MSGRTSATTRSPSRRGPEQIGADKLWGPNLETAGDGMKIGIIDNGLQATHPYFDPTGFSYPPGFPKGKTALTTPKVIVQRAFARHAGVEVRERPFDPTSRSTRRTSPDRGGRPRHEGQRH